MRFCRCCNAKVDSLFMSLCFVDGKYSNETTVTYYCHNCFEDASDSILKDSLIRGVGDGNCPYCKICITPREDYYYVRGYNEKGIITSYPIDTYCYNYHIGIPLPEILPFTTTSSVSPAMFQQANQAIQQQTGGPQPLVVSPTVFKQISEWFTKANKP